MSMISAQVDRLRAIADRLCDTEMEYIAYEMRDAADTIWNLRNKLAWMVDMRERARIAEAENDKLRELVRDMSVWAYISDYCDLEEQFADRMRELGIEVDE